MCGRYTLTSQDDVVEELQASLDPSVAANEWWKPRFNVAPTQPAPVVSIHDGKRIVEMMRWGLVPPWATRTEPGAKRPPLMINARVDSLHKPVFRDPLAKGRRCLIPADGFFEWRRDHKPPIPFCFHPQPRHMIAFAGLWTRAPRIAPSPNEPGAGGPFALSAVPTSGPADRLLSFTIIIGPANELAATVHDRMPVVLDPKDYATWLDPALPADEARKLLGIPPVGDWTSDEVSTWVNKADHDDPTCIQPVSAPQGNLFQ
jgi:putative SOS response-associated peptidase YedK